MLLNFFNRDCLINPEHLALYQQKWILQLICLQREKIN